MRNGLNLHLEFRKATTMPYTPLKIHIPEPCPESWEAMQPVTGSTARHCDSCAKNVVDFTGFTDAQVHAHLRQNEGRLCGRFRPDQLGRSLRAVTRPNASPLRIAAAAAGLLVAATGCESTGITGAPSPPTNDVKAMVPEEVLLDGLVIEPPLTGEVAPIEVPEERPAEIELATPGTVSATPPPPPPSTVEYDEFITGDISIFDARDTVDMVIREATPVPPPPPPPVPPPPLYEEVMGVVYYEPPARKPIAQALADSLRDVFRPVTDPASESPAKHPRPRPVSDYLQDLAPFPNPFVDQLTLEFTAPGEDELRIELLDASGRRIYSEQMRVISGLNAISIRPRQRRLKGQLFYLRMMNAAGDMITKPVVRQ